MPLTEDDILLGEKLQYYCSSSEDEPEPEINNKNSPKIQKGKLSKLFKKPDPEDDDPFSNKRKMAARTKFSTGPKGVLEDHSNYQKEIAANEICSNVEKIGQELGMDEKFFKEYREQRLAEMKRKYFKDLKVTDDELEFECLKGKFTEITPIEYTNLSNSSNVENVTIIIHMYDENEFLCDIVDDIFETILSRLKITNLHKNYIFVKLRILDLCQMSNKFMERGVPNIQILRNSKMLVNLVKLEITENIGSDFTTDDLVKLIQSESDGKIF